MEEKIYWLDKFSGNIKRSRIIYDYGKKENAEYKLAVKTHTIKGSNYQEINDAMVLFAFRFPLHGSPN